MPCTLEPWEIRAEERKTNKRKYGRAFTTVEFTTAVACAAMKHIKYGEPLPKWAEDWFQDHEDNHPDHEH